MSQRPRPAGKYLTTLSARCTPDLVGDAVIYVRELDDTARSLWSGMSRDYRNQSRDQDAQPPFTIATTVLRVLTDGYVHMDPWGGYIASLEPIPPRMLERTFTLLHGLTYGRPVQDIDLTQTAELAARIASSTEEQRLIADYVAPTQSSQPDVPSWVYSTIGWGLANQLATSPWAISQARQVRLHPDTSGGLVALDDPWESDKGGRFALSRTTVKLATLPNITAPMLLLGSKVTVVAPSLIGARNAIAVQGEGKPLLNVPMDGRGRARAISRMMLESLARLDRNDTILHTMDRRLEHERQVLAASDANDTIPTWPRTKPTDVWPVRVRRQAKNAPFGTGVGMEHMRRLHEHVMTTFGDAYEPIEARHTMRRGFPQRPQDARKEKIVPSEQLDETQETPVKLTATYRLFPTPDAVLDSVNALGYQSADIRCLWYTDEARVRMMTVLSEAFKTSIEDVRDGEPVPLVGDKITATFDEARTFLQQGPPGERPAAADVLGTIPPGQLIAALCETAMPVAPEKPGTDMDKKDTKSKRQRTAELDALDAKPQTRFAMSPLGVPNQYLTGVDDKGKIIKPSANDNPARLALMDLFRSMGVIDDRVANILDARTQRGSLADYVHVGIHVRRQNSRYGQKEPKAVVTATALVPPRTSPAPWTLMAWSLTDPVWRPYPVAQTAFHAENLPSRPAGTTERARWDEIGDQVERALDSLWETFELPYIVTVDGNASRRIWGGLANVRVGADPGSAKNAGKYWLPGASLAEPPSAVIRVTTDAADVPRPVGAINVKDTETQGPGQQPEQTSTPVETTSGLYEVTTDFGTPFWILCTVPHQYDGSLTTGRRLGSKRTRWDAARSTFVQEKSSENRRSEINKNWYAMTSTEILPLATSPLIDPGALAEITAKLCHQTMGWTERADYPVPLHAARQMDADHPQYRRSTANPNDEAEAVSDDDE